MARKIYTIENLDCANCAAKIEKKFNDHPKVEEATITFATKQLRLKAEDPDALIPELTRIARTVEREVEILPREENQQVQEQHCCCGHHHQEENSECGCHGHSCGCGNHEEECHCGHDHQHGGG